MNDPVDLTKCQPGDLLKLRNGGEAVYLERFANNKYPHGIGVVGYGIEHVLGAGWCYEEGTHGSRDVIAIIHPTRAELEEQRRELRDVLSAIMSDIPVRRDWLDPVLERRAKDIIKATNG